MCNQQSDSTPADKKTPAPSNAPVDDIPIEDITERIEREGWGFLGTRSVTPDDK